LNIVVVSIDRLHAGFLGCYGNTWVATPHFDRLASQGAVFDQALVDHPDLNEICRAWWTGRHALEAHETGGQAVPTLPRRLAEAGIAASLITDDALVASQAEAHGFGEVVRLGAAGGAPEAQSPAEEAAATREATLFASATEWLAGAERSGLVWIHSRGMSAPWDAPYELRSQSADEDDPPPPDFITPPCRRLAGDHDPDELWGIAQAYAGQVSLVDLCLGGLLEFLDSEPPWSEALLMVVGARGFPLGRRGRLGAVDDALDGELVQTPWLARWPQRIPAALRTSLLVQPCDLAPTLVEAAAAPWPDHSVGCSLLATMCEEIAPRRDRVCLVNAAGERGLRTPAWYLRLAAVENSDAPPPAELYSKPDDRWEVNDVAARLPDIVEALTAAAEQYTAAVRSGTVDDLPPLDEALVGDVG
jgi:arylsulfatase A-like enzyme